MGRKIYTFSLNEQDDRQLIRWLDGLPKGEKSGAIRAALHRYIMGGAGVTLGDVYEAVQELGRKVGTGYVVVQQGGQQHAEPPDVAGNIDKLGL